MDGRRFVRDGGADFRRVVGEFVNDSNLSMTVLSLCVAFLAPKSKSVRGKEIPPRS